jgi:hypothetical protein
MKNWALCIGVISFSILNLIACGGSGDGSYGKGEDALGAGKCGFAAQCEAGTWPADTDGDGCEDTCAPECRDPLAACAAPEKLAKQECPPVPFACAEGSLPGDTDGDGCDDNCVAGPADLDASAKGECADPAACAEPVKQECPPVPFACAEGSLPGDTDGDGCDDNCVPVCKDPGACAAPN